MRSALASIALDWAFTHPHLARAACRTGELRWCTGVPVLRIDSSARSAEPANYAVQPSLLDKLTATLFLVRRLPLDPLLSMNHGRS